MEEERARDLFSQLVAAIGYLHCKRVVHRDLKPDNLLLTPDLKRLNVIDFNHSRRLAEGGTMTSRVGSLAFAAPELLLGTEVIGEQVDIWSVGMCLYYMLSPGRLFFDPDDFPGPERLGTFLADPDTARRRAWVDQLQDLASEEPKEVILGCLSPNPMGCPEPMLLMAHPWVSPMGIIEHNSEEQDQRSPKIFARSMGQEEKEEEGPEPLLPATNKLRRNYDSEQQGCPRAGNGYSLQKASIMQACALRLCAGAAGRRTTESLRIGTKCGTRRESPHRTQSNSPSSAVRRRMMSSLLPLGEERFLPPLRRDELDFDSFSPLPKEQEELDIDCYPSRSSTLAPNSAIPSCTSSQDSSRASSPW